MDDYELSYVRNNIKDGANTVGPTRDIAGIILKIELFLISNKGISKDNSEVSS